MDLGFNNENWDESDLFDDLHKFAEEHAELGLDLGTSGTASSTDAGFEVSSEDLLSFLDIEQPLQKTEQTPPHQPISAVSPILSSRRNDEIILFNTAGELTQGEIHDLLYSGNSSYQNGETLAKINQEHLEDDNKDNIVVAENPLAEYFKAALSGKR